MNIISVYLLLAQLVAVTLGAANPWFLHSSAHSSVFNKPTYTVLHSTGNSTHFFLLDQYFSIHYFRLSGSAGTVVYDGLGDNYDHEGVFGTSWRDTRDSVDVKLGINPYNTQLYMVKYCEPVTHTLAVLIFILPIHTHA
ncbi:hypothetical protein BKA69DRAFT_4006 [Paraphysoderma sedebokerense]|nr:hypothetical protein BKA69DRAFT_4006 [Paraphysoderma sedebokerense]